MSTQNQIASQKMRAASQEMKRMSCPARCLMVIASKSPLFHSDQAAFFAAATQPGATLGDVLISDAKADRELRVDLNRTFGTKFSPGSFSSSTEIAFILIKCC